MKQLDKMSELIIFLYENGIIDKLNGQQEPIEFSYNNFSVKIMKEKSDNCEDIIGFTVSIVNYIGLKLEIKRVGAVKSAEVKFIRDGIEYTRHLTSFLEDIDEITYVQDGTEYVVSESRIETKSEINKGESQERIYNFDNNVVSSYFNNLILNYYPLLMEFELLKENGKDWNVLINASNEKVFIQSANTLNSVTDEGMKTLLLTIKEFIAKIENYDDATKLSLSDAIGDMKTLLNTCDEARQFSTSYLYIISLLSEIRAISERYRRDLVLLNIDYSPIIDELLSSPELAAQIPVSKK